MEFSLHEATLPDGQYFLCRAGRRASRRPSVLFPAYQGFLNSQRANAQHDTSAATFHTAYGPENRGPARLSCSAACFIVVPWNWSHESMTACSLRVPRLHGAPYLLRWPRFNPPIVYNGTNSCERPLSDGEMCSNALQLTHGEASASLHVQTLLPLIGLTASHDHVPMMFCTAFVPPLCGEAPQATARLDNS